MSYVTVVIIEQNRLLIGFKTRRYLLHELEHHQQNMQLIARQVYEQVFAVVRVELFAKRVQRQIPLSGSADPVRVVHRTGLDVRVQSTVKMANRAERVDQLHFEAYTRVRYQDVKLHRLLVYVPVRNATCPL